MKIVRSRYPHAEPTVPVRGGYRVRFHGGKASVPDDVADVLVALAPEQYSVTSACAGDAVRGGEVLVIRDMGLGDVLMTTPLVRGLVEQHGAAAVDFATADRYRCLLDGNPFVRNAFAVEEYAQKAPDFSRYAAVLDLRLVVENGERSGFYAHRADAFAAFGDVTLTEAQRKPDYFPTEGELLSAGDALRFLPRPPIGYVWRSSTANRNWSSETNCSVIAALVAVGFGVAVLDHEPQREVPEGEGVLNLTGCLGIRGTAAVLASCDACVTPDTGMFHLAAALSVPTVAYFGAFPAEERQAHCSLTVLNAPENCARFPCRSYICLNFDERRQSRCLLVSPQSVINALRRIFDGRDRVGRTEPNGDAEAHDADGEHPGTDERLVA